MSPALDCAPWKDDSQKKWITACAINPKRRILSIQLCAMTTRASWSRYARLSDQKMTQTP